MQSALIFFFSGRRRHTRWPRDWSSDVCSSDLAWENTFDRSIEADDEHGPAALTIIEWKREVDRRLYLCDEQGVALHEIPAAVAAPGFQYTAYLKSPIFRELESELPLAELGHETLSGLIA